MQTLVVETVDWVTMANMGEEALDGYAEKDLPLFRAIRDCLVRHSAHDKFGLYLVHKHFDVAPDEEMVEHVDFEKARVDVYPDSRDTLDMAQMVPTNWFFSETDHGAVSVKVAQWGHKSDLARTINDPLSRTYEPCLLEIFQILKASNALERFGMFLIRNQFAFENDENQLECTDHDARRLTLTTQVRSSDTDNAIPTNWHFTPSDVVAVNCCECARNSGGHLGYHRGRAS